MNAPTPRLGRIGLPLVWCAATLGAPTEAHSQDQRSPAALNPVPLAFEPCRFPGVEPEPKCTSFRVYEDRTARAGRILSLRIAVLPAVDAPATGDPLFILVGGPGVPATYNVPFFASVFTAARRTRDLVFVEQRGTGGSNRLQCDLYGDDVQSYVGNLFPASGARACREQLESRADLRLYTTPIATDDLDEIRASLGYGRINLFGTSYGTRGALVYLRRYPDHVRSVILKGVMAFNLERNNDVERAAALLADDCAADPDCRVAYPGIKKELKTVLRRLEHEPARVDVKHPTTGRIERAELGRTAFLATLLGLLQNVGDGNHTLDLIHRAYQSDFAPLARLTVEGHRGFETAISGGMGLSVFCAENPDGYVGPDELSSACAVWPRGVVPAGYREPVRSALPVLLISGFLDPITPPKAAEEVAKHLPNSRHVVIRYGSHSYTGLSPCVDGIMAAFLERASVEGLDVSCIKGIRRPAFPRGPAPSPSGSFP